VVSKKSIDYRILCSIFTTFDNDAVIMHPVFQTFSVSTKTKKGIDAPSLANLWGIGIQSVEGTLSAMTQKIIHSSINPIERRY